MSRMRNTSENEFPKRVAIIGLGPHARRIYYPYLEEQAKQGRVEISLIIDIESSRPKVEEFLNSREIKPSQTIYIPTDQAFNETIDPVSAQAIKDREITHVIIATEPKAHKCYLKFCIENDLKVLTDKPITSPAELMPEPGLHKEEDNQRAAKKIVQDVEELIALLDQHPKARVIVQVQRRYHSGYAYVHTLLSDIVKEHNIPITHISIHHSDGMWNMPEELQTRENHPYKYGYGKLMHSGYHFVDLFRNFLKINEQLHDKAPDSFNVYSQMITPYDHHHVIGEADYIKFFGEGNFRLPSNSHGPEDFKTYGELDSYSQWQFVSKGKVVTTAQLSLIQSGYSLRAWPTLPVDTYKSNGRIRHEMVNIDVGPLYNIQVHSYQATEVNDGTDYQNGVGSKNHFDIYIFKNSKLLGGEPLKIVRYGDKDTSANTENELYLGQNEQPRFQPIEELLQDSDSQSDLRDHLTTNKLVSMLYSNQAKHKFGQLPYAEHSYKEIFHE